VFWIFKKAGKEESVAASRWMGNMGRARPPVNHRAAMLKGSLKVELCSCNTPPEFEKTLEVSSRASQASDQSVTWCNQAEQVRVPRELRESRKPVAGFGTEMP